MQLLEAIALVRRSARVPYAAGLSPISWTHPRTMRAYWRVAGWRDARRQLAKGPIALVRSCKARRVGEGIPRTPRLRWFIGAEVLNAIW